MKQFCTLLIFIFCLQFGFGQVGFQEHTIIDNSYSVVSLSIFTTDLDGDGDMDVLSASADTNKIIWHENIDGQGSTSAHKIISTAVVYATSVYASDIDGDGDMDVLSASRIDNKIAWYENIDGMGDFGEQQIITTSANGAMSVYSVDIDNDGDMDVLSASRSDDKIAWYENTNGLGSFSGQNIITTDADFAQSVYSVDLDGDGDMDVLSASSVDDKIAWYENIDGMGNFGEQQIITTSANGAMSVYSVDLDSDGDMDVLSASSNDDKIAWYENLDGLANFGNEQIISIDSNHAAIVFAIDIDGDSDMDIVSASEWDDKIAWYENIDGLGHFGEEEIIMITDIDSSSYPTAIYLSDMDNDGDVDLLHSELNGKTSWTENIDGQGNFENEKVISTDINSIRFIHHVDIDGDSDLDVLSASQNDDKIVWFENMDGQGSFDFPKVISIKANNAESVYSADLDGDGDMDVLSASKNDNKISWYENLDGSGNFGIQQIIASDNNVWLNSKVLASDLDGDGDKDVIAGYDTDVIWYENTNGQGDFNNEHSIASNIYDLDDVFVGDVDGDGDSDILCVSSDENKIMWYENIDGQGNFGIQQIVAFGSNVIDDPLSVHGVDIDSDGDLDVLSASQGDDKIAWYENTDGLGNFGGQQIISNNSFFTNLAQNVSSADIDGDGDVDVLCAIYDKERIAWFENIDGLGNFSTIKTIHVNSQLDGGKFVSSADFDNDGDIDVISILTYDDRIVWYENLTENYNIIQGYVKNDMNSVGCDNEGFPIANIMITSDYENGSISTFTNNQGFFQLFTEEGIYNTSVAQTPFNSTIDPMFYSTNFNDINLVDSINFCIIPNDEVNDLEISLYALNDARPGYETSYQIVYKNVGTTTVENGLLFFDFNDNKMDFVSATESINAQYFGTLVFEYLNLQPFEIRTLNLSFDIETIPVVNLGDILSFDLDITPWTEDATIFNNSVNFEQTVIGSYDPNDITVLEGDEITIDDADKYLHYLIRFQNTGTASAINVRVEHILDNKLDWSTMQLESLSHTGRVEIENETDVSFIFNNINLPDSTNDEPNSHGFIAFKIKPKSDVQVGDVFSGVADIFFDFNPPIITNTVNTEIVEPLSVDEFDLDKVKLYPNPASDVLEVSSNLTIDRLTLIDLNGRELTSVEISATEYRFDISALSKGAYFLEIHSNNSKSTKKFIKN